MFVELIESLRCPNAHEESPLVVSASRTEARHIVDGVLGCPVCNAEFPVENGVAKFAEAGHPVTRDEPSDEAAMRLAAFLRLTDASGAAVLCGRFASQAPGILAMSDTPLVLVNAPEDVHADVAGSLLVGDVLPFAPGTLRAAALDDTASAALVESIVRAVRTGGRLTGPVRVARPEGTRELARDEQLWVAEKTATSEMTPRLVTLGRASR